MISAIPARTIWLSQTTPPRVQIVDQRQLPHQLVMADIDDSDTAVRAIQEMWVRGAPLIGAMAAYGYWLAVCEAGEHHHPETYLQRQVLALAQSRPTAVNLQWALDRQEAAAVGLASFGERQQRALAVAKEIVEEDVAICHSIGQHGWKLIEAAYALHPERPVQILTHCNAGRMATIEWGTATAPIYLAHQAGIPLHVWVDETRPRNQGARITAWELAHAGVPHTLIADNSGGHLMQHGMVDLCIVGTDRTARNGDVANKIGTYLKALAAWDNQVPFYVALPSSTIDWSITDGLRQIPIEQRDSREVSHIEGWSEKLQTIIEVRLGPEETPAANYAFDVTPARYVSGLITERGICLASEEGLLRLFPERG